MIDYLENELEPGDAVIYSDTRGVSLYKGLIGKIKGTSAHLISVSLYDGDGIEPIKTYVRTNRKNSYNLLKINEEELSDSYIRISREIKGEYMGEFEPQCERERDAHEQIMNSIKMKL